MLYLYPPRFRREFGAQMRQDFAQLYRSYRRQPTWRNRIAFWALIGKDVAGSLWREYRALLPAPRGWWWLRLVGLVGVGVGVFYFVSLVEQITDLWLLPDMYTTEWWWLCMPLSTFAFALPLCFGLWTMPGWRLKRLVRGLSVALALAKVIPAVLQFIWLKKLHESSYRPARVEPILGSWEPFIIGTLLPGISMAAIVILGCLSLRQASHRWWSLAMIMIYVAPVLTYSIARALGYIPPIAENYDAFREAMHIVALSHVLPALGWIFFGAKIWMSVPRRDPRGHVVAAG
ncbi:MAG TPA: hypothetical protein VD886_07800 [Herpetosiphonaceae bacterium]|nr:hypothetical protein [Herpetosiphonaceae bacterium]